MLKDSVSPDGQLWYYVYQFDYSGFGYSRLYWAVTSNADEVLNLKEYKLPDGYRIIGGTKKNELETEEWNLY